MRVAGGSKNANGAHGVRGIQRRQRTQVWSKRFPFRYTISKFSDALPPKTGLPPNTHLLHIRYGEYELLDVIPNPRSGRFVQYGDDLIPVEKVAGHLARNFRNHIDAKLHNEIPDLSTPC